jgi:hypothetical protein
MGGTRLERATGGLLPPVAQDRSASDGPDTAARFAAVCCFHGAAT